MLCTLVAKSSALSVAKSSALLFASYNLSKLGICAVGLFGSYLRNEQTPQSDIDVLVDFEPEQETFENFMAV
jgi:predicted nucleotidyltransferase